MNEIARFVEAADSLRVAWDLADITLVGVAGGHPNDSMSTVRAAKRRLADLWETVYQQLDNANDKERMLHLVEAAKLHWRQKYSDTWFAFGPRLRVLSEQPLGEPKSDTKSDTPKKEKKKIKKRRSMNAAAIDCCRRFKAENGSFPMKTIVDDYVSETGNSTFDSIMRVLNDNPEQWKGDTKTT